MRGRLFFWGLPSGAELYGAEGKRRMSEATTSGTGSFPDSQSRTSVGHTPSFSASRAFPHEMRRNSRFS
jgi:hypothetical protein